jgi:hypothetical protein
MFAYVEAAMLDFISTYLPHDIKHLIVWSDGGPHHFKIWKTVNMFHYLSKLYSITFEYHFFESYHGHSMCDAHSAHVRRTIKFLIRDGTQITTIDVFMDKIVKLGLKNATFEKMCPLQETMITELKKTTGLRKLYKFVYDGHVIKMYATSTDEYPAKTIKFD